MCGICGFVGFEDKNLIKEMCRSLSHRGPNNEGIFLDKNISLGHRRLSIIDLSKNGNQPMTNEDESLWIVYNGEIYNFQELKKILEDKGHRFVSNTDTEVLLHGYEEYGLDILNKINGMFAFALYDNNKKELLIARDRLGIKPVYYYKKYNYFLFASEIKALLKYEQIERKIDISSLNDFLTFRYVPEPKTMFKDIFKIPSGSYLLLKDGKISINKYWDINYNITNKSEEFYTNKFRETFENSVKRMLISDVPLGVYLSGGIDSSSIVSVMSKLKNKIQTFTIGYNLKDFKDETEQARKIAQYFNTDHNEVFMKSDLVSILPKILWYMDEPIADPTAIPLYLLSHAAKKKLTVTLVGDGADELFAGYEHYKIIGITNKLPKIGRTLLKAGVNSIPSPILNKFFKYTSSLGDEGKKRFNKYISEYDKNDLFKEYTNINSIFIPEEKKELCKFNITNYRLDYKNKDVINNLLYFDQKLFLSHLLTKTDKMTMANSIEARVPFLDNEMIDLSLSLPSYLKLKNFKEKYILKKAMKNSLPEFIVKPKKQRFFVPIHYFSKELIDITKNVYDQELLKYFNKDYITNIINKFDNSKLYYGRQLWSLANFGVWHKIHIEKDPSFIKMINKVY